MPTCEGARNDSVNNWWVVEFRDSETNEFVDNVSWLSGTAVSDSVNWQNKMSGTGSTMDRFTSDFEEAKSTGMCIEAKAPDGYVFLPDRTKSIKFCVGGIGGATRCDTVLLEKCQAPRGMVEVDCDNPKVVVQDVCGKCYADADEVPADTESYILLLSSHSWLFPFADLSDMADKIRDKLLALVENISGYNIDYVAENGYGDIEIGFTKPSNPIALTTFVLIILGIIAVTAISIFWSYTLIRVSTQETIQQREETKEELAKAAVQAHASGAITDEELKGYLDTIDEPPQPPPNGNGDSGAFTGIGLAIGLGALAWALSKK